MAVQEQKKSVDYKLNEQLKPGLGKREIAFEYQGDETENIVFVFKIPNMGQQRALMNLSDNTMTAREKSETTIRIFKELVKNPTSEVFEQIYNSLFADEIVDFTAIFISAMEMKRKK